jgi:hypothetical protein
LRGSRHIRYGKFSGSTLEPELIPYIQSPLAEIQTELATVAKHREKYEHYLEHQRSKKAKLMEGNVKLQNSIVQQREYARLIT